MLAVGCWCVMPAAADATTPNQRTSAKRSQLGQQQPQHSSSSSSSSSGGGGGGGGSSGSRCSRKEKIVHRPNSYFL